MTVCLNYEMVEVVLQIAHWDIDIQPNLPRLCGTWQYSTEFLFEKGQHLLTCAYSLGTYIVIE